MERKTINGNYILRFSEKYFQKRKEKFRFISKITKEKVLATIIYIKKNYPKKMIKLEKSHKQKA